MMSLLSGPIARSTLLTSAVLSVRLLAVAVQMLLVARLLGPAFFSHYVAVGTLAVIMGALSTFGTQLLVLRDAARGDVGPMLSRAMGTWAFLSPVLFLFYLLACHAIGISGALIGLVLGFGLAEFFLQPLLILMAMLCQGRGEVARAQRWLMVPLVLRALWVVMLWQCQLANAVVWLGFGHVVAILVCLWWLGRRRVVNLPQLRDWRVLQGRQWKEAGSFALLGLTSSGQAEVDKLLAVRLLAAGPAGAYAAASRVVSALVLPVVSLLLAALPRLFSHQERDLRLQLQLFIAAGGYALLAAGALWMGASWVARTFGPGYESMEQALRVLVWAVPAQALRMVILNVAMTKGNALLRITLELTGIAVLVICASLFAGMQMRQPMAVAVIVAEWVAVVTGMLLLTRQWKIGWPSV